MCCEHHTPGVIGQSVFFKKLQKFSPFLTATAKMVCGHLCVFLFADLNTYFELNRRIRLMQKVAMTQAMRMLLTTTIPQRVILMTTIFQAMTCQILFLKVKMRTLKQKKKKKPNLIMTKNKSNGENQELGHAHFARILHWLRLQNRGLFRQNETPFRACIPIFPNSNHHST